MNTYKLSSKMKTKSLGLVTKLIFVGFAITLILNGYVKISSMPISSELNAIEEELEVIFHDLGPQFQYGVQYYMINDEIFFLNDAENNYTEEEKLTYEHYQMLIRQEIRLEEKSRGVDTILFVLLSLSFFSWVVCFIHCI